MHQERGELFQFRVPRVRRTSKFELFSGDSADVFSCLTGSDSVKRKQNCSAKCRSFSHDPNDLIIFMKFRMK